MSDQHDREWTQFLKHREVMLFARLLERRMLAPSGWVTEDELMAYLWLHNQADTIEGVLDLVDDPSSGFIAGFPFDGPPGFTGMPSDDLRPIDRDPAQQARARAALVAERAGYMQQIHRFERGEITADFPVDAETPTFRPADAKGSP